MRVVFVDPGFGKRSWNTFGQSHWTSIIHQGLCGLSACLKQHGYSDIHLLDIRQLRDWPHLENSFRKIDPDVVCLTMRSCDYLMVLEIAQRFKKIKPSVITVVGGVHVSIDPGYVTAQPEYDYIIAGEGEISIVKLLKALEAAQKFSRFCWGDRPNLDELPFIDRELYPYEVTIKLPNYEGVFSGPMVTMIGERGCAYRCSFCAPHSRLHYGPGIRRRSPENTIKELKLLYDKYRFNSVKFYDYSFTQKPLWVEEFCDLYAPIGKPFWIQSRSDLICKQEHLIKKLAQVGLKLIGVGFESGSDKVLAYLKKDTTREINLKAAEIIKKNNILLSASLMLGTPFEEDDDVQDTVSMVKKMKPHFTSVAFFTPIPGNELYKYCKENDLILSHDPEMYIEFSPEIPKIKGKDYEKLKLAASEIMGNRFGGVLSGKVIRYLYIKTKYHYWFRKILVFMYSSWVASRLYNWHQRSK